MITIIGDVMLDEWILGTATRLSPEAPVPVLKKINKKYNLGGAANLAANLSNLDIKAQLFGAISYDQEAYKVLNLLKEYKNIDFVAAYDHSVTTTKIRAISQSTHMFRIDSEEIYKGSNVKKNLFSANLPSKILVISDYNKGVIDQEILDWAVTKKLITFIDPKGPAELYKNQWLVKPNQKEFESWGLDFTPDNATKLAQQYNWEWLVVTRGANGIFVTDKQGNHWSFNQPVKNLLDVTGAGDCVLAVLVWGVLNGHTVPESAKLACRAATKNIEKPGVVPITKEDLFEKVVFTNGCFDILHAGHFHLLKHARELGDKLVVGLNSDASVKKLKGNSRPINSIEKRIEQLTLLPWVDDVIVFDEETPIELIEKIQPSIIVKGGDYDVDTVVGNQIADVVIVPILEGFSTTNIIKELQNEDFNYRV
jgi:D-beta-D-heptose 7-phosphate kinase / D-beta-D-heptose 1-phosphate adenosyltransferase